MEGERRILLPPPSGPKEVRDQRLLRHREEADGLLYNQEQDQPERVPELPGVH